MPCEQQRHGREHVGPMVGAEEADVHAGTSEPNEKRAEGGIDVDELEEGRGGHCACDGGSGREGELRLRRTGILEGERNGGRGGNAQGIGGRIKWTGLALVPISRTQGAELGRRSDSWEKVHTVTKPRPVTHRTGRRGWRRRMAYEWEQAMERQPCPDPSFPLTSARPDSASASFSG